MGRGGSRYGAGRPGWRRKCENMLSLDIRKLAREGCLTPGRVGGWHWSCDGEPAGNIGYRAEPDCVRLIYTWTPHGSEPIKFDYPVWLSRTPCHYGGTRPWFICPRCGDLRAVIYGIARDGRFGCRDCLRLGYASEAEDVIDRCWRAQRKVEAKLTGEGEKPKAMRQRTFDRLMAKWEVLEDRKDEAFVIGLASLARRLGMKPEDF